jgi:hypothetical protein
VPNAAEFVSLSLNCTSGASFCERSDMVNASHDCLRLITLVHMPGSGCASL